MEIRSISQKIFKTNSNSIKKNENQTNPFGVSFKGNMITADVFEKKEVNESPNRGKIFVSTLVGSINAVNSAVSKRLNSVVSFGRRLRDQTNELWDKANNIEIHVDMADFLAASLPTFTGAYTVNNLRKRPVTDLRAMFENEIQN